MKIQKTEKEHQDIINLFNRIVDDTGKLQVELQQVMRLYIKAKTKARSADKGKSKHNVSGAPRKHGNAYTCFVAKNYKRVSDEFPSGTRQQEVIASLGRKWKVLPKKEKEKYEEIALKKAKQYKKNLKAYEERQGNGDGDATVVNDNDDESLEYEEPEKNKKTASKTTTTKRSTRQITRRAAATTQSVAPPSHEKEEDKEEQSDKGEHEQRYDEGDDAVEEEPDKGGDEDKDMYFDANEEHPPLDDNDFEEGELEALLGDDSEGTMDFSSDDDVDMFDAAEDMLDDDDDESLPESSSSSSTSVVAAAPTAPITKPNAKSEKGKGKAF